MAEKTTDDTIRNGLKKVMRIYPQGVTVVTTETEGGPMGITVSSFTSVSLNPPLILVSIAKGSHIHEVFSHAKAFAVNFLADDQISVSDRFAGRTAAQGRFSGLRFERGVSGSPLIDGVRAVIECATWRVHDEGDHSLILGKVISANALSSKRPLVYYGQQYTSTKA